MTSYDSGYPSSESYEAWAVPSESPYCPPKGDFTRVRYQPYCSPKGDFTMVRYEPYCSPKGDFTMVRYEPYYFSTLVYEGKG